MTQRVVTIGAGQAAQSFAETLRKEGFSGAITLVGDETDPPYQRPPLSKKYLLGDTPAERLAFRPPSFFEEQDIALRLGAPVSALDRGAGVVRLADGAALPYDAALIATGARPRRVPEAIGGAAGGVYVLRSRADVDAFAPEATEGRRAVVVGGGYIGLEAAAVLAQLGLSVTLLEAAPRILARVAAQETADFFTALHESHGVAIRTGAALERLEVGAEGRVTAARLATGETIPCDVVLVGIGVAPNQEIAEAAGLAVDNGVVVDSAGRTSDPAIFAAGDVAAFPYGGARLRLESVQNAIEQAAAAARALMGAETVYAPTPWFWSDQYDVKLQIAGLGGGADRVVVRPGRREGAQSHWYFKGGALLAVDAINEPPAYMLGKRWLEEGRSPDAAALADPEQNLKTL